MTTPAAKRQVSVQERLVPASGATRLVLLLLALWTAFFGLTLTFFQGAGTVALSGSAEDEAARRLLGVHALALAPVYALLGWNPRKYGALLWLPYVTQFGIVAAILFDLVNNNLDFGDAGLPLVVSIIFLVLLAYLWRAGRRPAAEERVTPAAAPTSPPPAAPPDAAGDRPV